MKKILITLSLTLAMAFSAQAQFINFGVRGGLGFATHIDDLARNSPVLAANLGGFVTYGFTQSQSLLAEHLTLQTGVNLLHRGSNNREVLEMAMSIREAQYSAWYAQVPILVSLSYELPIRQPGHNVFMSLGPAVNVGLFGTLNDTKITRGLPQPEWNYRKTQPVFDVIKRIDASFLLGFGYEHQDLSVMLQMDLGCMSIAEVPDALALNEGINKKVPLGNNFALLLTVGYQFPIR